MQNNGQEEMRRALGYLEDVGEIFRRQLNNITSGNSQGQAEERRSSQSSSSVMSTPGFTGTLPSSSLRSERARSTLDEVRNAFAPYTSSPGTRSLRRSQPLALSTPTRGSRERQWNGRLFCLSGPSDTLSPAGNRRIELESKGFGMRPIHIRMTANSTELQTEIVEIFPQLKNVEFEVLRAVCGGHGKPLARISRHLAIPNVIDISTVSVTSVVYLRPTVALVTDEEDNQNSNDTGNDSQIETTTPAQDNPLQVTGSVRTNQSLTEILNEMNESFVTLNDWRADLYHNFEEGDATRIFMQRDDFVTSLLGIYKRQQLNIYKPVEVIFAGEAGADAGALTKEFFWCGIMTLREKKYNSRMPFFEGEKNAMVPTADALLLRTGVFHSIGKFMLHSAVHTGIGFVGLSSAVAEYLMLEEVDSDTPIKISVEDVAEADVREVLEVLAKWKQGDVPAQENLLKVHEAAMSSGFHEVVDQDSINLLHEHLLYYHVIEKRKCQLDSIRFRDDRFMKFVNGKDYLVRVIFPSLNSQKYPADLVIKKIQADDASNVERHIKNYISEELTDEQLRDLVIAWTGWPELPDNPLKIIIVTEAEGYMIRACLQELYMPETFSKERVYEAMAQIVSNCYGFGLI